MAKAKNLQIGNNSYTIRDANTYRSLSTAQATTLLNDGLYNGEEVDNGEIFTTEDGAIKQYVKEDLGVGIDVTDYNDDRIPCNKVVIENGAPVLYATNGTDTTTFLKSTDYGKTWTSVASNRGSLSCYKQRMFYENGVFYVMRTTDGSSMLLDVSTDNMQTWNTYSVGSSSWYYANNYYIAVNSTYIVVGYSYSGTYRQFRAPLSDLSSFTEVSDWGIRQVYVFNDLFVCESKYSSDASTWASNNMPSTRNGVFFKNNKMYVQANSTPAVLYESSDGMAFTSVGTYSGANAFDSYATYGTIDEVYAFNRAQPGLYYSTKDDLLTWTKISDDFIRVGEYEDVWFVNNKVCFEVSETSNTRRGIAGVQYNRSLKILTKLSDIAEAGKGIKFEGNSTNYTLYGSPTIDSNYVASNFSEDDRIIPTMVDFVGQTFSNLANNYPWKFKTKINLTTLGVWNSIFGGVGGSWGIDFYVDESNRLAMNLSGNGYDYSLSGGPGNLHGTTTLSANTDYWIECGWDGSKYYAELSTDGTTYTTGELSLVSSTPIYSSSYDTYLGFRNEAYLHGSMSLPDTSFNFNNGQFEWSVVELRENTKIAVDILFPDSAPSSSLDGFAGQIAIYNGNAYICVDSSNTWKQITS